MTRLLHKVEFKPRQRKAAQYLRRYVLTEKDVPNIDANKSSLERASLSVVDARVDKIWKGFEPLNNRWDARLFFDICKIKAETNELSIEKSDSSDEEGVWGNADHIKTKLS